MSLTINLPEDQEAALIARARAEGLSAEECAEHLIARALGNAKPLAERIRALWSEMPAEVQAKLPVDGASQHDHYIYGVPKRNQ